MSLFVFIGISIVIGVILISRIPGLEHFVKPLVDILFTFVRFLLENSVAWAIYIFKTLWYSHLELLQHLLMSAESIDPSVSMRKQQ